MNASRLMNSKVCWGIALLLVCVVAVMLIAGCTAARPDPEEGVRTWIAAVNDRDYAQVYAMAPREIREQVTEDVFIAAQDTNPFLASGNRIGNYTVIERNATGDTATITAQLLLVSPGSGNATTKTIVFYLKFVERFEDGEWKVWTAAP
jgi:hypothetical protein